MATEKSSKKWQAIVYDSNRIIQIRIAGKGKIEELIKEFDFGHKAVEWVNLRLVKDCGTDCYAEVSLVGTPIQQHVSRDEAMLAVYGKKGPGPVYYSKGKSNGPMGYQMKVHESRIEFSRG